MPNQNFQLIFYLSKKVNAEPYSEGEMFFYGGSNRRIRKLKDCTVQNIGFYPFPFNYGACAATNDQLFLCFDQTKYNNILNNGLRTCRISNEPTGSFKAAPRSIFDHGSIQIATSESKPRLIYICFHYFLLKITDQFYQ